MRECSIIITDGAKDMSCVYNQDGDILPRQFGDMGVREELNNTENTGKENQTPKVVKEEDYLYDKSWTCPICGGEFKELTVRNSKVKLLGSDQDLRPRYEQLELLKYDVVLCRACGYTALGRYFDTVTQVQAKYIREKICANFTAHTEKKSSYTYDEALWRYRMALANAVVKGTKASEKAYICLKTAWLLRSRAEHLDQNLPDYEARKKRCGEEEREFLLKALDGFIDARASENFPMCGMDEETVDYLIAALAAEFERYDVAARLVVEVLHSTTNPRLKDRARDLKDLVSSKMKEKKEE